MSATKYDQRHCHKWALLLQQRREKQNLLLANLSQQNFDEAKRLFQEIYYGVPSGKNSEPGMVGSLLYHMAMVTKMETETSVLLKELNVPAPDIAAELKRFYGDFALDLNDLLKDAAPVSVDADEVAAQKNLTSQEKIDLFLGLNKKTEALSQRLSSNDSALNAELEALFEEWTKHIAQTRLRQEYETIRGILNLGEFAKALGVERVSEAMAKVQEKFGQETVSIALDVTLKVGLRREKLQSVMLSDHYIKYVMNMENLDGDMQFLNCPIYGGHKYIGEDLNIPDEVTSLFCRHFCFAHAKAMLENVMPFPFTLTQPQRMATDGKCNFHLKIGHSPKATNTEKYVPLILSWNVTRECNMKCSHCYINASPEKPADELDTQQAKDLIDQITQVSRPMLILSGGEPLLRKDIYEIIRYGTQKGLRMGMGSNGSLITPQVAKQLKDAGIKTVSISLDSSVPEKHDEFRGVEGAWQKAVDAIKALRENDVLVQVNTTLTMQNYDEIDDILSLAESLGVENFHLFFLVPTGRGAKIADISPAMYEDMIKGTFAKTKNHKLNVRPSCAPQFMRIAKDMHLDMRQWIRGCLAGLHYCRIYTNGDVTPCPYLPVKLGNIRETSFKDIWFGNEVFQALRDPSKLEGKCGECDHKVVCGGCRARAYGLSSDFIDYCGDLHEPANIKGNYLAEDPWCVYQPPKKPKP
ncbi:MAG: radical SAM protein [Candidatus Bathyarchaeota archaeon]|nr:radical SAM protein [Candidatus Bathyarchaeota archaeon]